MRPGSSFRHRFCNCDCTIEGVFVDSFLDKLNIQNIPSPTYTSNQFGGFDCKVFPYLICTGPSQGKPSQNAFVMVILSCFASEISPWYVPNSSPHLIDTIHPIHWAICLYKCLWLRLCKLLFYYWLNKQKKLCC